MGRFSLRTSICPSLWAIQASQAWGPTSQAWGPASQAWGPASQAWGSDSQLSLRPQASIYVRLPALLFLSLCLSTCVFLSVCPCFYLSFILSAFCSVFCSFYPLFYFSLVFYFYLIFLCLVFLHEFSLLSPDYRLTDRSMGTACYLHLTRLYTLATSCEKPRIFSKFSGIFQNIYFNLRFLRNMWPTDWLTDGTTDQLMYQSTD